MIATGIIIATERRAGILTSMARRKRCANCYVCDVERCPLREEPAPARPTMDPAPDEPAKMNADEADGQANPHTEQDAQE